MTILQLERPLHLGLNALLVALVALLLVLMTAQVALRYGFGLSLIWAEEICRYLLIWLSFLGVVLAYEKGEIAALTFLGARLPRRPALALAILCNLLSLGLALLLVWYGWRFATMAGGAPIPALGFLLRDLLGAAAPAAPGTFWVYVALPLGMALVALRIGVDLWRLARALPARGPDAPGVAQIIDTRHGGHGE